MFISLLGAISIFSRRGHDIILMRSVAKYSDENGVDSFYLIFSIKRIATTSSIGAFLGCLIIYTNIIEIPFSGSIYIFPISLFLLSLLALFSGYVRGLGKSYIAPFFEIGGISFITTIFLLISTDINIKENLLLTIVFCFNVVMIILSIIFYKFVLHSNLNQSKDINILRRRMSEISSSEWRYSTIAISGFLLQAGSFLFAAPFLDSVDIGIIRAAERISLLISFPQLVLVTVLAPQIAKAVEKSNEFLVKKILFQGTILAIIMGFPIFIFLLLWPSFALNFLGSEFIQATIYLRVMAVSQIIVLLSGLFISFLDMSGKEKLNSDISVLSLLSAIIIIPSFSIFYGPIGFILAYCSIIFFRGLILIFFAARFLFFSKT